MGLATANLQALPVGREGRKLNVGVKGGVHIYDGTLIAQILATGMAVPYSTAASGSAVGVATMEQDNTAGADGALEVQIEWDREFVFANGTGADQVLVSTPLGTILFGSDDHTIALTSGGGTREPVGYFCGLEPDGRVRVFINAALSADADGGGASADLTHVTVDIPLATIQAQTSGTAFNVGAALPATASLIRSQVNVLTEVTGGTLSAVKAKLQGTGTAGELVGGSAGVDVFGATGPYTDVASGTELNVNRGGQQLKMTLTATGDTLADATAGHLSVDLYYATA
jgi:hypothetical protein